MRPNTWQLDPAQFTIMNPEWNSGITNLADVVERELGCDPSLDFHYELYKFLLYEQGSFFKVHVDLYRIYPILTILINYYCNLTCVHRC